MRQLTQNEIEKAPDWATDFAIIKDQVVMIGGGQITKTEGQKVLWSEVLETDFEPIPRKEFDIEAFEADDMVKFYIDSDGDLEFDGFDESYLLRKDSAIAIAKHFKLTAEDLR